MNKFVMDKDTDYEMSLQFDGDSIFLDDEDGIDFEFEREPAEKETEEVKKDVKESAFIGVWKADNVDFEGISSTPDTLGVSNVFVEIQKGKADFYITGSNFSTPVNLVNMKTTFEDGVLCVDIEEDDASEEAEVIKTSTKTENKCEFYFTDSEALKMRLYIDGSVMEFEMEKSNQKELAKAKSGTGTVEVKADEKESKTGKTTTETMEEYIGQAKNSVTTES